MKAARALLLVVLAAVPIGAGQALDLSRHRIVDLTHALGPDTLFWPTSPTRFEMKELAHGKTPAGYFYSAYSFCTPEHGGTHLDAPIHFSETGRTADRVPLEQLIGPAAVLDVTAQARSNRDYRLTRDDVLAFEKVNGMIQPGDIVLVRTGWSRYWPDPDEASPSGGDPETLGGTRPADTQPSARAYLGDDTPGDASRLSFPGYGEDAARLLVEERRVAALGIDTASIDYGRSQDFMVHRIAASRNVPGLENLTNLDRLPSRGATVIALPVKIKGGSGGPVRVVALVP